MVTSNGQVQTNEEAQIYVRDLNLFVTVHLLVDSPSVLSLCKLCEEHYYTCEWASDQKAHLTKNGKRIPCKMENFVPIVLPGLSSSSSASSSSTSFPQDSSSTSPSPASLGRDKRGISKPVRSPKTTDQKKGRKHSHDSDSERPTKVTSRKHSTYTHFPTGIPTNGSMVKNHISLRTGFG